MCVWLALAAPVVIVPATARSQIDESPAKSADIDASGATSSGLTTVVQGGFVETILFYLFGGAVLASAIGVCVSKSVVRMAVWLFGTLGAVAVLYLLLGAAFLGAVQLIVYAGGTLILLIFGVMLTTKSPWVRFEATTSEMLAAGGVVVALFIGLATVVASDMTRWPTQAGVNEVATVKSLGESLLTTYLVPFEAASVVLLVVMIGAAYLARQER
ncbi:MAG: hypothetical protein HOP29_05445 [Phycisphaerales bacterium]|nr:hypothetical protein [Phycisphaerales bacterium]